MQTIRQYLYSRPRLFAALLLLGGIGVTIHLMSAYHSGDSVFTKDFTYAPVMLAYGLGALIQPHIITAWLPDKKQPGAALFKALSITLLILGFGLGLCARQAPIGVRGARCVSSVSREDYLQRRKS